MASEKIEVQVPTELLEFARKKVNGHEFACVDDVIAEALGRFRSFVENAHGEHEWLKAEIEKGIAELRRGEVVEEEAVFDELDEILARKTEPAA
jgi:Arc/MetJ-type ribon-helix-helix transcriptional regulator